MIDRNTGGGGMLSTMTPRTDRTDRPSAVQGDTRPPPIDYAATAALTAAIAIPLAIAVFRPKFIPRLGAFIVKTVRQRAAFVICLGAAIVAADYLVFADLLRENSYFSSAHKASWIALAGVAVSLLGIYHWIGGSPNNKK